MPAVTKCLLIMSVQLLAAFTLAHAQSTAIVVTGSRPIAEAVAKLEMIYGVAITYEDPLYIHPRQIVDPTASMRSDQVPGASTRALIPKYGTATFTYDIPTKLLPEGSVSVEARKEALITTMPKVLESYAPEGTTNMFSFNEQDGMFHVVPKIYMESDGSIKTLAPLLDTLITIPPGERTASQLLEDVCQALSKHFGHPVIVGMVPTNIFQKHLTTVAGTSASARSILGRLLLEFGSSLSWQLFYDPGLQWYALNIHPVPDYKPVARSR